MSWAARARTRAALCATRRWRSLAPRYSRGPATGKKTRATRTTRPTRTASRSAVRAVIDSWLFNLGADIYGWFTAQRAWRASCARLAARLGDIPDGRIADLGCGPGVSTFELARRLPGARLVGLDIAPRMLGEARRRRRGAGIRAR